MRRLFGLLIALDVIRETAMRDDRRRRTTRHSVLSFPVLRDWAALILVRMGQLLRAPCPQRGGAGRAGDVPRPADRAVRAGGDRDRLRGAGAGRGRLCAGGQRRWSIRRRCRWGCLGLIFVLQDLVDNLYALITRQEDRLTRRAGAGADRLCADTGVAAGLRADLGGADVGHHRAVDAVPGRLLDRRDADLARAFPDRSR